MAAVKTKISIREPGLVTIFKDPTRKEGLRQRLVNKIGANAATFLSRRTRGKWRYKDPGAGKWSVQLVNVTEETVLDNPAFPQLDRLRAAIHAYRKVRFSYVTLNHKVFDNRAVDPHYLFLARTTGNYIMTGWDQLRNNWRSFRTDAMTYLEVKGGHFYHQAGEVNYPEMPDTLIKDAKELYRTNFLQSDLRREIREALRVI